MPSRRQRCPADQDLDRSEVRGPVRNSPTRSGRTATPLTPAPPSRSPGFDGRPHRGLRSPNADHRRAGIGLDSIDFEAAGARGVAVYHTPEYCVSEVAGQTLTNILMLVRQMRDQMIVGRTPGWTGRERITIHALEALTVGVVGAGRIRRAVLERLAPFSVRRLAFDPVIETIPNGVERADSLDARLEQSDVVTLHLPLVPETRGLISRDAISHMRQGAYLVNVSRGPLVDTTALAEALDGGLLAGAVVDVFEREPVSDEETLLASSNAILTPHIAWQSVEAGVRVRAQTLNAVLAYLLGSDPAAGRLAVRP
jgi:D-3-phosphoglycerate dehydrogenase / 2-oxoglutarate reductase